LKIDQVEVHLLKIVHPVKDKSQLKINQVEVVHPVGDKSG